jgi:hypothetical protein
MTGTEVPRYRGGAMVFNRQIAYVFVFLAVSCAVAFAEAPARSNYTRAEIQKMIRDAHTAEQYRELAEYYRSRQQSYEIRAREERHEWVRRTFDETAPEKYPTPEDASRYRYEYFTYEAARMGVMAARYTMLATELMR